MAKKRKVFFGVIGAIVAVGIIGSMGEDEPTTTVTEAPKQEEQQKVEKAPAKEEPKAPAANIGDALTVGEVTFTISGKTTAANVGGEYGQNAQGKYLILDVVVKNGGKEPLTVDSSFFKIKANGAEYEPDATADIYANEAGGGFFLQSINPGIEHKGKIVFDLPAEVADGTENILQVQTGFFGTETGEINLK